METALRLRIMLINPPAGVDFGVQKGRGGAYETVCKVRSTGGIHTFDIEVGLKPGPTAADADFSGPLVQGPRGGRFLYLDIGTVAGQVDSCWSRRLKIPLTGITQVALDRLAAQPDTVLETRIAGTARDGGPTCGTVKPFHGWIPINP